MLIVSDRQVGIHKTENNKLPETLNVSKDKVTAILF